MLLSHIYRMFIESKHTYGSPRAFHALKREGIRTSKKRVARLMKTHSFIARDISTYSKLARVNFFICRVSIYIFNALIA